MWIRDWWSIIKCVTVFAVLTMGYLKFSDWVVKPLGTSLNVPLCPMPNTSVGQLGGQDADSAVRDDSANDGVGGTGVAGAALPSRPEDAKLEDPVVLDEHEVTPLINRQCCDASGLTLTGCTRAHLAGLRCVETDLGKYFLLEYDSIIGESAKREAFLRACHGKEYIMMIQIKRRAHAGCWNR